MATGEPAGPIKGAAAAWEAWRAFSGNAYEVAGVKTAEAISRWCDEPSHLTLTLPPNPNPNP